MRAIASNGQRRVDERVFDLGLMQLVELLRFQNFADIIFLDCFDPLSSYRLSVRLRIGCGLISSLSPSFHLLLLKSLFW